MSAKNKSPRGPRQNKTDQASLRRDTAALIKLVAASARQIKDGVPLVMVVTVVDTRNNGLAALMIKGPPPPPPLLIQRQLGTPSGFAVMVKGQPGGPTGIA